MEEHMRTYDRWADTLYRDGFVAMDRLIPEEDISAACAAAYTEVAPPFERRSEKARGNGFFPWDDAALNRIAAHPAIIAAAERFIGTRELQLRTGFVWVKYSGIDYGPNFHIDFANNTLGPVPARDDFQHLSFFVHLTDVDRDHAPILMAPNGRPESEATAVVGAAGTVCAYSMYTRHSASPFARDGHRATMWVNICRKDRPWDNALRFEAHAPEKQGSMKRFIASASPRQLEFIGFPRLGDPLWTPEFLAGMAERYPGFDVSRYAPPVRAAAVA
jgi:hypothetical protein